MVKYQEQQLDRMFSALSDATRRGLLAQLESRGSASVSELAEPFAMTLPAVVKHLDVLADAGLATRAKNGRVVTCALNAQPMETAMQWLNRYARFWSGALDRLAAFVEKEQQGRRNPDSPSVVATKDRSASWTPEPASPSSGASKPRRPRSSARGRTSKR